MRAKHPSAAKGPRWSPFGAASPGAAPEVDAEAVEQAVRSFNSHSGAGPSGLRPVHLKECPTVAHRDEVPEHLTAVVRLMVRGRVPASIAPWLAGAQLVALPRKDGGIHPVAVGEVLRRLAGKTLCKSYQDQARQLLWPLQIGVGLPLGIEVGLQTARH